jgi:hypothetical protein
MQLSYLPLAWLNILEQSIIEKLLIVKLDALLPQILALMKRAIAPMRSNYPAFFSIVPQLERNSCQA